MQKLNLKLRASGFVGLVSLLVAPVSWAQARTEAISPEIFTNYCITCHNERLQTAGLSLDRVDLKDVSNNAEILEKVVRKLRSGQMPPEGRPRPDAVTIDEFAFSLENALDHAAAADPNPGRVASRRLNRLEYVNAIYDLLALEIDGNALLPGDMAGFGFDNNADVLSITPSLMARYIAAATKISRAAVGSRDNRPVMQVYNVGYERRDLRAGDRRLRGAQLRAHPGGPARGLAGSGSRWRARDSRFHRAHAARVQAGVPVLLQVHSALRRRHRVRTAKGV